ncbi:hypothetical protein OCO53_19975 [Peribacillus frigoritolerans]|uniref:hypothetical protein n=1 Tax=Peribacillus frigoritolerans TaxID=450367 RepID=UPI0021D372ED|nr:hypothetical protein [Peribacillus frigoritolerans]MCU6602735.1 hypothetical protein [Peribacillus frigoritolerans]
MKWLKKNEDKKGQFIFGDYINEYALILLLFSLVSPFVGIFIVKVLKLGSYENGEPTGDVFTNLGVFGDFLGGSTLPFLTLITITYVYKTFKLQEEQLRTQKEEMRLTRSTLDEQTKTARLQRFENSFFIQLKDIKDKKNSTTEIELDGYQASGYPIDKAITVSIPELIYNMNIHYENEFYDTEDKNKRWNSYKDHLILCFELPKSVFSKIEFQKYIFSIMRCFQLLNRYKGIMDDDEVRYYLRYIIDEIGEECYRVSMLYIIAYSERYLDYFKAIKELKLHEFALMNDTFDTKLTSSLHFINYVLRRPATDH